MSNDPTHQFQIFKIVPIEIGGIDFSFTNASLFMRLTEFVKAQKPRQLSSEFISAIVVGAVLGWLFDHFVGTTPWGLIVLLLLGFCAGVLNVLRAAGKVSQPLDRRTPEK